MLGEWIVDQEGNGQVTAPGSMCSLGFSLVWQARYVGTCKSAKVTVRCRTHPFAVVFVAVHTLDYRIHSTKGVGPRIHGPSRPGLPDLQWAVQEKTH